MQGVRIGGNLVCLRAQIWINQTAASNLALKLQSAVVSGDAAFEFVKTNAGIGGRQASVSGTMTLAGSEISGGLELTRATISGDLSLDGKAGPAKVGAKLGLGGATINGRMDMGRVDLSGVEKADLSRCKLGYLGDSEVVWPETEGSVLLEGVDLGGIATTQPAAPSWADHVRDLLHRDRNQTWLDRRLRWLQAQGKARWSPEPYGQVVAALKLAGEDSLAREVAIARERDRRKRGGLSTPSRGWNLLLGAIIAYGYKPYRVFTPAVAVIALGWLVFNSVLAYVHFQPDADAPHFYSLVYSIDVFLPIIDLGQVGPSAQSVSGRT